MFYIGLLGGFGAYFGQTIYGILSLNSVDVSIGYIRRFQEMPVFPFPAGKKTALYISHRLASCRFCGDILVFDNGRVVQRGSHEQLVGAEGLYRELWNAQAQYYQ